MVQLSLALTKLGLDIISSARDRVDLRAQVLLQLVASAIHFFNRTAQAVVLSFKHDSRFSRSTKHTRKLCVESVQSILKFTFFLRCFVNPST